MADGMNKPAIRFAGFTDAWEQRKLGELVDRVVRKNTNNESTLPLTISAQYGLVDQITYFNNRVASRDVSNYYLVLNGEFAYNKSTSDGYPFGAVKRLDLYEKGVLSTLYIVFSPKKEQQIDSDFLTVFFDTDRWHKGVAERAAEGARNHGLLNISAEDFFDIDLSVPKDVAEQKQIGAFIRQLDHLITLHQREYAKLVNIKASMLEKMFPKDGSAYPEVRFAGFTDAWEQRKLGEVAGVYDGVHQTPFYTDSGIMFLSVENIGTLKSNKYISEEAFNRDYKVYPQKGDILMTRIGDVGTPNVVETSERIAFYVSLALLKPSKVDSYFLCNSILSPFFQSGLKERTLITAIPQKINKDEIGKVRLFLPSSTDEQVKIGAFFHQLDNLITLHQRKLEKLQNIKKSMLEKMFV